MENYDNYLIQPYDTDCKVAFCCDCCGKEIYVGEDYYKADSSERFCDDCITRSEADDD